MLNIDALHGLIQSILSRTATDRDVTDLVRIAYHIALVRLRQLVHSGRLHLQSFSVPLDGTAFDCIAEMFKRDGDDGFVELMAAFSGEWDFRRIDPPATLARFRSVVFTHVQKGIIRLYKEHDPVFSRILRNIRLVIKRSRRLTVIERLGMQYVSRVSEKERNDHLPEYPLEELDSALAYRIRRWDSTAEFVDLFFDFLSEQRQYRQFYPVFDIALLMKRHMVRERVPVEQLSAEDTDFLQHDIKAIIQECLRELESRFSEEYVVGKKITGDLFRVYCRAIGNLVVDVYARNDGQSWAQPDYLEALIPGLTREEYRRVHRTHFEYMVRVARKHVGDRLKELL